MIETCEALVFDYDGVIANTERLHWRSWADLLARYGIRLGWDEYRRIGQGVSDQGIYEHFRARMPGADAKTFAAETRSSPRHDLLSALRPLIGAIHCLLFAWFLRHFHFSASLTICERSFGLATLMARNPAALALSSPGSESSKAMPVLTPSFAAISR